MRNYSFLLWILLFVDGVSGDGKDEVKLSVTEGDSVTLSSSTVVKRNDQILWKFGGSIIVNVEDAEGIFETPTDGIFKDILKLDNKTGSLTITNVTSEHAGRYQLDIKNETKTQSKCFSVTVHGVIGVDADKMKSVMEGDSVTLNPDPTQIQGFNQIQWRFGEKGSTIAQIDGVAISYPHLSEIFGGRLQLNQTGSLTINNMRTKHSGLYKLQIYHNTGTSYMTFSITVYESPSMIDGGEAEMKSVSVKEGYPVILQTDVKETQGDELIVWRFGDEGKLIAKCDIETKCSTLYKTDERFRDRLKLDHQTGSLTINNTRTTDSGLYRVKISSTKQTSYKRFTVTVSGSGLSPGAVAGIVVVVLLLVFSAVIFAGVIYYRRKISERRDLVKNGTNDPLKTGTDGSDNL